MSNAEHIRGEGKVEKFARKNTRKSLVVLGGAAVGAVLLPPAGAAVAVTIAAGAGIEAIGSNMVHTSRREKRLKH